MYNCSLQRLDEKIKTFSKFGDTGKGGVTRFALSEADIAARKELVRRCEALGCNVVTDDMANIYATLPGTEDLPAILSGSHLDSVRQGGNFDGVLGVLAALEALETVVVEKIEHRHPLTLVVWTNEEGARFEPAMMSSGVICGKFKKEDVLKSKDAEGITFGEALTNCGFAGDATNRVDFGKCAALYEMHIEQGPVLETENIEIGAVAGVCGMINYEFTFVGQAGHAGTTPMPYRKDALFAAVKTIQRLHDELDKLDPALVYTTGKISCHPNIHTIIPDEVRFTLDARHYDPAVVAKVLDIIKGLPKEIEKCSMSYSEAWSRASVAFDSRLVDFVSRSAEEYGYTVRRIHSGPGHDAQYVSELLPAAMIFVPSVGGHSHCEEEFTGTEACLKGVNVLLSAILKADAGL
jgi:N-carbamoyl-L-amino-acid hydrolase